MKKQLKLVAVIATMLVAGIANAQQESGDIPTKNKNVDTGKDKTVRVIDNKGTIKYLQVQNGITTLTNEVNGKTTTTWQLGGTLATNTTINLGATASETSFTIDGEKFTLKRVEEVDITTADGVAATVTTKTTDGTDTGFTFLVREERTGQVKKMKAQDILNVVSFHKEVTVGTIAPAVSAGDLTTAATGVELTFKYPNALMASYSKVQVYRNGAKLRANVDYKIDNSGANSRVYLITSTTAPYDWSLYDDDIIEVHATK